MAINPYLISNSEKMYKANFKRWRWHKNKTKPHNTQDGLAHLPLSSLRQAQSSANCPPLLGLEISDSIRDSEHTFLHCRTHIRGQFESYGWSFSAFTIGRQLRSPLEQVAPDFYGSEITLLYCIHNLRQGRVALAFSSLSNVFNNLMGAWRSSHPKLLGGHWSLLRKIHDICIIAQDYDFALLRELLRFEGIGAQDYLKDKPSPTDPVPNVLKWLALMRGESPEFLNHVMRTGMVTAATTLEETVGLSHPTVLLAWTNVCWYWKLPSVAEKDVGGRFESVLAQVEAALGTTAPITIGVLHDFANFSFFHDADHRRQSELGTKLLESTKTYVLQGPPDEHSQIPRAYAFGTLLLGLLALEDNRLDMCRRLFVTAVDWLLGGSTFARMQGEMLQADFDVLTGAWQKGSELRTLELNFLRPRCFDTEREEAPIYKKDVRCLEEPAL
jgi:hypothetical protein